jgi:large subunit ribosomal protein L18
MNSGPTYQTKFKRRASGKTDYRKRLAFARSKEVRIAVRKTNKQVTAQAIAFNLKGDETIAAATSKELSKFSFYGTNNTPSAYLTGFLLGKRMAGLTNKAILDIGRRSQSHGSVVFACLKGLIDAGITIPHSPEAIPSDKRINGSELDEYAKQNPTKFSNYQKAGINPGELSKAFEKAKAEIEKVKPTSKTVEVKK